MRGGEKPFEILSAKEKEAFKLASDILQWSSDPTVMRWPGVAKLRDHATKLYELVSNMDVEHDDRYYKAYEAFGTLQKDYQRKREWIERDIRENKHVEMTIDLAKDTTEELLATVKRHLDSGMNMIQLRHINPSPMPYGDSVEFSFYRTLEPTGERGIIKTEKRKSNRYNFSVDEMFDHSTYKEPYSFKHIREAVEQYFEKPFNEIGDFSGKLHDFGGPEYWIKFENLAWEEVEERLRLIFDTIKAHPRQLIQQK